ncbi:MAG: hypothetical protein JSV27_12475 [Candidatus Bathyarchaeota archaeon]|nr:MAG: hypothetical protein JSV27_12475 [Candidatus Bathyarchaeota archaeon]
MTLKGEVDWRSYQLGAIAAFAEVVENGCKRLALSSPMTREQLDSVIDDAHLIAGERDLILHVDDDFLETILFDHGPIRGKTVIHIVAEQATVDEYLSLKEKKRRYAEAGTLTDEVEHEIAWGLGRLLSYDDDSIRRLLRKRGR